MDDLREQKKDQWITIDGNVSLWTICFQKDNLFNETSARSLYFVNNNPKIEIKSDTPVILDDDRNMFDRYLEVAVQDVLVLLARRIPQSVYDYESLLAKRYRYSDSALYDGKNIVEFNLVVGNNHDDNLLSALKIACKEFLVKKVLEQWYNADFGSEVEKGKIVHILQYRRKSVARRVRPLL